MMMKSLSVAVACGLAGLLVWGVVGIGRAQQAEPRVIGGVSPNNALRERLITLKTDVDALQLDCDAIRAGLLKTLEGVEQGDILGIDVSALLGTAKLELSGVSGNAESLKEISDLMRAMESDDKDQALGAMKKAFKKQKADFQANLGRKKQEYVRKLRSLHEKMLDLEEVEKRYAETR